MACVLIYAVFPVRTYLDQRAATRRAHEQIAVISELNERLEDQVGGLGTPDEVERIAREDYGMVRPGEEPYSHPPAAHPDDHHDHDDRSAGLDRVHAHHDRPLTPRSGPGPRRVAGCRP